MANEHFYPEIEPFDTRRLAVDAPHELYVEQCGKPDGIPIVFLHGGPGAGCWPVDRRFFDPSAFRVVLFDQRGAGRSTPAGDLTANTTADIVGDIDRIRQELEIDRWHVFGGSWGSTLALAYAQAFPTSCLSLVLRGIWLMRPHELRWWLYDIRQIQPEIWQDFADPIPEAERDDLLEAYWRRLTDDDMQVALPAARSWSVYEGSCCTLLPNDEFADEFAEDHLAYNLARLEAHYFRQGMQGALDLLGNVERIRQIPAFAVHGRYDIVCPIANLFDLTRAWPELDAAVVPDAGHSSHEPGVTRELVAATKRIAETGSPIRED